ncbi:hypothetical protein CA11_53130 [Gimesia maris]|uniref:hypothetical protein n=1 Tax=Gimesia maris TaxID=122 RepID=UPI001189E3FC|nr:hypothetical protein [Gimesia maris]QDU17471.1 hypothetical protein CA11_53130 [Gimesia maris]
MTDDEFIMTYPCYFPYEGEKYNVKEIGGVKCFNLLTDRDLVERYFQERYPGQKTIQVEVRTMPNRTALINTLKLFEESRGEGEHDIEHITFDVIFPNRKYPMTTIKEFIEYLEEQN